MINRPTLRAFLASFVLFGAALVSEANAVPLDFDRDGASDLAAVRVRAGTLVWRARLSGTNRVTKLTTFGVLGNHLAPASWRTAGEVTIALIAEEGGNAVWRILESEQTLTLGSARDLLLSGADFDGSGLADAAAVRLDADQLVWSIAYDPFVDGQSRVEEITFGDRGDVPLFLNPDGVRDWLAVLKSDGTIRMLNTQTREERAVSVAPRMAKLGRPLPLRGADGIDRLVFVRSRAAATRVHIWALDGTLVQRAAIRATSTVLVGDYDKRSPGEEIAVQGQREFVVYAPATRTSRKVRGKLGIAFDEININSFSGNDRTPSPGLGSCSPANPNDGSGGFVWKPNSDTTHYAVAVMPGALYGKVQKVEVFSGAGERIKELGYFGCGNPDARGPRCNFKDFSLTGADYRRQYGSIILKLSLAGGSCRTYAIDNPARRVD